METILIFLKPFSNLLKSYFIFFSFGAGELILMFIENMIIWIRFKGIIIFLWIIISYFFLVNFFKKMKENVAFNRAQRRDFF